MGKEGQKILVDVKALSQGMKTVFNGCAMIFDSLGVDGSMFGEMVSGVEKQSPAAEKMAEPKINDETAAAPADAMETIQGTASVPKEEAKVPEAPEEKKQETEAVSTVTVNDIIRIASAKITANRKNSEKIGTLVRSYGVTKMSELPEEKFEAFLTDISQL